MNLEKIEEKCLHYLGQASNPLVPLELLIEFCKRDPECGELDRKELLEFLRPHEMIEVMEGPSVEDIIGQGDFQAAGINMGQRAILKTRVPAKEEMTEMLFEQLKDMTDVLIEELDKAKKENNEARVTQLELALKKGEALGLKMNKLL